MPLKKVLLLNMRTNETELLLLSITLVAMCVILEATRPEYDQADTLEPIYVDQRGMPPMRLAHPNLFRELENNAISEGVRLRGDDLPKAFLRETLQRMLKEEDYENAAIIRDELNRLS